MWEACGRGRPLAKVPEHQEREPPPWLSSHEWYACVHTPIPIQEANKIPKARQAIDAEWDKLGKDKKAWDLTTVCERTTAMARAKQNGITAHFGSLMTLCHIKHS